MRREIRLEKYLVECGVASRRKIKKAILEGRATINGKVEYNDATEVVVGEDIVMFDGVIPTKKELKYYIMNKLGGYITAMGDENRKTILDILPEYIDKNSVFPVGRLDKDTEGLLIFTNDGDLSYFLSHPDNKMEKTYYVELNREISDEDIEKLEKGVTLDTGYEALPGKVEYLNPKAIHLTVIEGKYHQVKKMLKAVGNRVVYLKRVKYGKLELGNLELGEMKEITKDDII